MSVMRNREERSVLKPPKVIFVMLTFLSAHFLSESSVTVSHASPIEATGGYRLSPGDKIAISILGQPEFSGEHQIDDAGEVTLPAIGLVRLIDMKPPEAEKLIGERLAKGYLQQPVVSVRISELRPVYVMGDVRTPSSYPFRYGMTVLGSLAVAGGFRVAEQLPSGARSELLMADERLKILQSNRRALKVRHARVDAQLKGSQSIQLPGEPYLLRGDLEVERLVREEEEVLRIQNAGHQQTLNMLREQRPLLEAEKKALRDQIEAEARQLELIQSHISDYNNLVSSGLTRRFQLVEYQRQEASHKANLGRLAADQVNLEMKKGELSLRMQEAENEYKRKLMTEMQETRTRLDEVEIMLPIAREIREARLQQGGGAALAGNTSDVSHITIVHRMHQGKLESQQVDVTALLLPGDVVEFRPKQKDEASLNSGNTPPNMSSNHISRLQ